MAATPKVRKKTYAGAVAGVTTKSAFASLAKCQLKRPKHMPNARIPNTKEEFSFFVDLKSTNATEAEVLNAIEVAGIVGVNIRDDLWVVEFVCKNEAAVDKAMNTVFNVEGKKSFEAILPRHKTNRHLLIKVLNVPFRKEEDMKTALTTYWTQYGKVIDAAPYKFPGKPWLTRRWDVLLELNDGTKKLDAPTVFSIDGLEDQLVCSWPSSRKSCLHCRTAGHSTSHCPLKKPGQKVGASTNPPPKIGSDAEIQTQQGSASMVSPATPNPAAAPIVTPATHASSSTSTDMEIEASVAQSSAAPTPTASESSAPLNLSAFVDREKAAEQQRTLTPPPQLVQDPDTPKKAKKRMSKDQDIWTPSIEDLKIYVEAHQLCRRCFECGHMTEMCPKKSSLKIINWNSLLLVDRFRPYLEMWAHSRRKKGNSWHFFDPKKSAPYNPTICSRCHTLGHKDSECQRKLKCNHCSGDHLGINCPSRQIYAFE